MVKKSTDLISPAGTRIVATLERLSGLAFIVQGSASRSVTGALEFEYEGTTEIDWDTQETVVRDGQRVFLDREGRQFLESEISLAGLGAEPAAEEGAS